MKTKTSIILIFIIIHNSSSHETPTGIPEVQFCEYNTEEIEKIKDFIYIETVTPNGVTIMADKKKPIGSGSFGKVYDLGEGKALKLVKLFPYKLKELTNELKVHNLFENDVTSLSHLESCYYFKSTVDRKIHFFLIMDYYKTGSLFKMIDTTISESLMWKFDNMYKITKAIKKMHDIGYAHLDIKLENIFYMNIYTPILGDFGLSMDIRNGETRSTHTGTKPYAAPETYLSKYDLQTDIYALGVLFYEIILSKIAAETKELPDIELKENSSEMYHIFYPLIKKMVQNDNRPTINTVMSTLLNNLSKIANILDKHVDDPKNMKYIQLEKYMIYEKNTLKKETENLVVVRYKNLLQSELKEREKIYKRYKFEQQEMIIEESSVRLPINQIEIEKELNLPEVRDAIVIPEKVRDISKSNNKNIISSNNKSLNSINNIAKELDEKVENTSSIKIEKFYSIPKVDKSSSHKINSLVPNLDKSSSQEINSLVSNLDKSSSQEINSLVPNLHKIIKNDKIEGNDLVNKIAPKDIKVIEKNIHKNIQEEKVSEDKLIEEKNFIEVKDNGINNQKENVKLSIKKIIDTPLTEKIQIDSKKLDELKIITPKIEEKAKNFINDQFEKLDGTPITIIKPVIIDDKENRIFIKIDENEPILTKTEKSKQTSEIKYPLIEEIPRSTKISFDKSDDKNNKQKITKSELKPKNLPKIEKLENHNDILNKTQLNFLNNKNLKEKNQMKKIPRAKLSSNKINTTAGRNKEFLLTKNSGIMQKNIKSKILYNSKITNTRNLDSNTNKIDIKKLDTKAQKLPIKKIDSNDQKMSVKNIDANKKKIIEKKSYLNQSMRNIAKTDINKIIGPALDLSSIKKKNGVKKNFLLINKMNLEKKLKNLERSERKILVLI